MHKRLTRSRIRGGLAYPVYLGLGIINNYFANSARLSFSRIGVELAFPTYLGFGIT